MQTIKLMLNLKNQLRAYLDHMDLSASQLARRSGVSKQTISYWLAGGEPRRLSQLKKVAQALNTTIDELAFGDCVVAKRQAATGERLEVLVGDEWMSGRFEVELKIRKLRRNE